MKKSLLSITALITIILGPFLNIPNESVPFEPANAYDSNDYEFHLSKEVLLSQQLVGLEQTPYRSIKFKELKNGHIEMTLLFDVSYSDSLVEEYTANGIDIPIPEIFTYEITEVRSESNTVIHLLNEEEGLEFVFTSDQSGFIYDQIGYGYMIVQN